MAFRRVRGLTKKVYLPMTASVALAQGKLTEFTTGLIAEADDNDTALAGVLAKTIASTDEDYATSGRFVPVEVPVERHVTWECDAAAGSGFTASDIGGEFGISDSGTLDQTDTTNKVFLVTKVLSATKVQGFLKINGSY